MKPPPRILSIAGSDSSGGAGVQADLKTIAMLGGYGMTAITAVTAQNSVGVQAIAPMGADMVAEQIASCIDDIGVDAIKIGMLHDRDIVDRVADSLARVSSRTADDGGVPVVLDPVMIATSGATLIAADAIAAMRERLFPLATIVTPNIPELEHLAERKLATFDELAEAAEEMTRETGAAVLAKGGHTEDSRIVDMLVVPGSRAVSFNDERIDTPHTHGTGCTLSAALATLLGHDLPLEHAVRLARQFTRRAIEAAPGFGEGNGPLGHQAVRNIAD